MKCCRESSFFLVALEHWTFLPSLLEFWKTRFVARVYCKATLIIDAYTQFDEEGAFPTAWIILVGLGQNSGHLWGWILSLKMPFLDWFAFEATPFRPECWASNNSMKYNVAKIFFSTRVFPRIGRFPLPLFSGKNLATPCVVEIISGRARSLRSLVHLIFKCKDLSQMHGAFFTVVSDPVRVAS